MTTDDCRTCRHWVPPEERTDFLTATSKADQSFGRCEGVPPGWDIDPADVVPLAVVVDGSMYQAVLFTRAEYGCVLHAGKP